MGILFSNYNWLLLHYNLEFKTHVSFHVLKAHLYLPMASKLVTLQGVVLTKAKVVPDQYLKDVAFS